jgi:hypothetical protein
MICVVRCHYLESVIYPAMEHCGFVLGGMNDISFHEFVYCIRVCQLGMANVLVLDGGQDD